MNSYRQGSPVFRLTHQGSVPLTPSDPIVYAKNLATLCSLSTPKVWQLLIGRLARINCRVVPALSSVRPVDVHVLSVRPVVCAFGYNNPSFLLVLFVDRVVAIDR